MQVYSAQEIRSKIKLENLLEANRLAFKAFSSGRTDDVISHLQPNGGEVHVKAGFIHGSPIFAVKISAGFTANTTKGLPVWDGMIAVFDASTGQPIAILQDQGILTDWRTAIAGAIATQALAAKTKTLGIIGTGLQDYWQPLAHRLVCEFDTLLIWGRNPKTALELAAKLEPELPGVRIQTLEDQEELVHQSDTIITVTSSQTPVIQANWLHAGQHITAIGADAIGKLELSPEVLKRADVIVVDSLLENKKYGDIAAAIASGAILETNIQGELGALLEGRIAGRTSASEITIAKLVGLGVQDLAAASAALEILQN